MKCNCGGRAVRDPEWLPEPGMDPTIRQYTCQVCHKKFQYPGGRRMKVSTITTTGEVAPQRSFFE